jgi:hypothetical protein
MHTNPVLDRLGSYPIAELQEKARAMRAAGRPLIDFSVGDPREPTPGFIPDALKASIPTVSQYPTTAGLPELRRAVADYVHRRFGVEIDPDLNVLQSFRRRWPLSIGRRATRSCGRLPVIRSTNGGRCWPGQRAIP